jgi:release factor glutamine methyltransferase
MSLEELDGTIRKDFKGEFSTVNEILAFAKGYLEKCKVKSSDIDARLLFSHVYEMPMTRLYISMSETMPIDHRYKKYAQLINKRGKGYPAAYLIGTKEFHSLSFEVNEHTLIPRPDTESLVSAVINHIRLKMGKARRIEVLDIGTGSGCVGVTVAKRVTNAFITAADISLGALAVAARNAIAHGVEDKISMVKSDLFSDIHGTFDIIVSNPPYIPTEEIASLERDVRDYEPRSALDGGADGMDFYRRMIPVTRNYLNKHGTIILEVGNRQSHKVSEMLVRAGFDGRNVNIMKDLSGKDRVVQAVM